MTTKKIPEATETETDIIEADPTQLTLSDGTQVEIERLKTRQLFRLLRVLTVGAGDYLSSMSFSSDMDTEEFTGQLLGAMMVAVPEAEDEAVDFVRSMVSPKGISIADSKGRLSKAEQEIVDHLNSLMQNAEIEDTLDIIINVVKIEAPHIQSLGKKISALLKVQQSATTAKQGGSSRKSSGS